MSEQTASTESDGERRLRDTVVTAIGDVARRFTPEFVRRRYAAKFAISMLAVRRGCRRTERLGFDSHRQGTDSVTAPRFSRTGSRRSRSTRRPDTRD